MRWDKWVVVAVHAVEYKHGYETDVLLRNPKTGALTTKRLSGSWTKAQIEGKS